MAFFVAFACAAEPQPSADEVKLRDMVGGETQFHFTEHFALITDAAHRSAVQYVFELEPAYKAVAAWCRSMGRLTPMRDERLRVVFFDQPAAFEGFCRRSGFRLAQGVGGYDSVLNVSVFYDLEQESNGKGAAPGKAAAFNRLVLRHELAHHVLYHFGIHKQHVDHPAWLVEGLACYFETAPPDRHGQASAVNALRLSDFQEALGPADAAADPNSRFNRAVRGAGPFVPLEVLISDDQSLSESLPQAAYRYAQAWALVHYLQAHHDPEFRRYLLMLQMRGEKVVVPGAQEQQDFESCFGRVDDAFVSRWLAAMDKLSPRANSQRP